MKSITCLRYVVLASNIAFITSGQSVSSISIAKDKTDTEVVELGRFGFTPKTITRSHAGKFYLYIRKTIPNTNVSLQLSDRASGGKLKDTPLPAKRMISNDALELNSGTYVLLVAGHPDWTLEIEVSK
jgi:hypothetical protein